MGGLDRKGRKDDVFVFDTVNETVERKYATQNAPSSSDTTFFSLNNACATGRNNSVIALVTRAQGESDGPSLIEYNTGKNALSLIQEFR